MKFNLMIFLKMKSKEMKLTNQTFFLKGIVLKKMMRFKNHHQVFLYPFF